MQTLSGICLPLAPNTLINIPRKQNKAAVEAELRLQEKLDPRQFIGKDLRVRVRRYQKGEVVKSPPLQKNKSNQATDEIKTAYLHYINAIGSSNLIKNNKVEEAGHPVINHHIEQNLRTCARCQQKDTLIQELCTKQNLLRAENAKLKTVASGDNFSLEKLRNYKHRVEVQEKKIEETSRMLAKYKEQLDCLEREVAEKSGRIKELENQEPHHQEKRQKLGE